MELKKVWMAPDTAGKSRYSLRVLGGIAGITALAVALIGAGVWLTFALELPREGFSLFLVCAVTALMVALALRVGWRSVGDATVFFLTREDRLYVMDVRDLFPRGHHMINYVAGTVKVQEYLRALAREPRLPAQAEEVARVESIRENGGYYAIRCRMVSARGAGGERTWFLVKGCRDEDTLLRELRGRQDREGKGRQGHSRTPVYILTSALALGALGTVCVLSHPAQGILPREIYFPCLGAAFLAFFFLVYFVICYRRGR